VFWGGALLLGGIAAGFALVAARMDHTFRGLADQYAWLPFLWMPLGLMLVNWLTRRFFPGAGGSGIPQVIAALQMKQRAAVPISITATDWWLQAGQPVSPPPSTLRWPGSCSPWRRSAAPSRRAPTA